MEREFRYVKIGPLCVPCSVELSSMIEEARMDLDRGDSISMVRIADVGQLEKNQGASVRCAACGMGRFSQL